MLLWIIKCRAIAGLLRPNLLFLVTSIKMSVRTPYSFTVGEGGEIGIGIISLGSQNHCPLVAVWGYFPFLSIPPAPVEYEFIQYGGAKNRHSKNKDFCVRVLFRLAPYYCPLINTPLSVQMPCIPPLRGTPVVCNLVKSSHVDILFGLILINGIS